MVLLRAFPTTRHLTGIFSAAVLTWTSVAFAGATPRPFSPGSLIIPMDNCWQDDIAQPTHSKQQQLGSFANCGGQTGANSSHANGARRTYGLIWLLLKAGVPLYWIINPNKQNVDDGDLTIDVSGCSGGADAVRLIDQSVPASVCGLDQRNPKDVPSTLQTPSLQVPPACVSGAAGETWPSGSSVGTYPLGTNAQPAVTYRGGPFVIDAKDAALARDVMAWYWADPGSAFLPLGRADSAGTLSGGSNPGFIDPGHYPLHWSQYTPSALVPIYPSTAFGFDISAHQVFAPCTDPSLCPFTTWDPISPSGHVDPWGNLGNPAANAITYATVNVHQAQYQFTGYVAQVIDSPIPTIALAGITDPVHMNTFRFYLEEAGLTFGPCNALPPGWVSPGGGNFSSGSTVDYFFDPTTYPFPGSLTTTAAGSCGSSSAYLTNPTTCSEGLATDDPVYGALNPVTGDAGTYIPPSLGGGPYGQVLDIIAPEATALRNLLEPANGNLGCGAPRYSQLWIPHWDALLQMGPNTEKDPLAAAMSSPGVATCPGVPNNTIASDINGKCPWNGQLVQTLYDDLRVYVAHGGNLLAECLGAASLEDSYLYKPTLWAQFGIDQMPTHFMTEWDPDGGLTAFRPNPFYDVLGGTMNQAQLSQPTSYATACMDSPTANVDYPNLGVYNRPNLPPSAPSPVGFPGNSVLQYPQAGGPGGTTMSLAYQVNANGGVLPESDAGATPYYHVVEYAPLLQNGANQSQTTLSDPFLQLGDFYFLGIYGATESFTEGANTGYTAGVRNPNLAGYAYGTSSYDTEVLIRGLAGTSTGILDSAYESSLAPSSTNSVVGDYWLRNRNSMPGAGTVVYLQGDSFDGRPDGLRLVWSSILNLSYVPLNVELSRSSPTGYSMDAGTYLLQGTFVQSNVDYSRYTPVFSHQSDTAGWIFPPERGHLRGSHIASDSCFTDGGINASVPQCKAAVTGVGANTTNFNGFTNVVDPLAPGSPITWDTSENVFGSTSSLLLNSAEVNDGLGQPTTATANPFNDFSTAHRVLFTHLYQANANSAVGLKPVTLYPTSAGSELLCSLFPKTCGANAVAYPEGNTGIQITGPSQCDLQCTSASDGGITVGSVGSVDAQAMLEAVYRSNGGCTPLLSDTCYANDSTQVACLDQCWAGCLSTCIPPIGTSTTTELAANFPPFSGTCQTCGFNCAQGCNGGSAAPAPGCTGTNCCGVNATPDVTSFREACYPAIGGVDHSTPVVVGPAPANVQEYLPDPTSATLQSSISAQCRPTVAYVGAGDGMLHAIFLSGPSATDSAGNACPSLGASCNFQPGQEMWAFMPNQNLPLVRTGGDCTRSLFVDGVPVVKDVYANFTTSALNGPSWHSVLTETLGQGGNHVFALDVTDPLAPLRGGASPAANSCGAVTTDAQLANAGVVLWEQGDPLDTLEPHPVFDPVKVVSWSTPSYAGTNTYVDTPNAASATQPLAEGPGFKSNPNTPTPSTRKFRHYQGQSSSVFMGSLVGSGASQTITYLSAQNVQVDGYGVALSSTDALPCVGAGCNTKDASNAIPNDSSTAKYGPAGEVVYAFDSATGIPRTYQTNSGGVLQNILQHFAELYDVGSINRLGGNNDIPAPPFGVSTSQRPETDLLIVPDLDGQVWGLLPATLAPNETLPATNSAFPLFDIQKYGTNASGGLPAGTRFGPVGPLSGGTPISYLLPNAAFANPVALLPSGACPSQPTGDTVVVLATGGVDWGPPASMVVELDVSVDDMQSPTAQASAINFDSSAEVLPITGGAGATSFEIPTCQSTSTSCLYSCVGRVFGEPLVVGDSIYYSTSTGLLTGVGSSIDQSEGNGAIATIGGAGCSATSGTNCNVCNASESSHDLQTNVGKTAAGLTAIQGATGTVQIYNASVTGLSNIVSQVTQTAQTLYQKLALQQWWLRPQRPTECAGGTCN